ncbi:hypothetical protein B0H10DRAFT_1951341, partial [Mycena sp. CBHHK59/15]
GHIPHRAPAFSRHHIALCAIEGIYCGGKSSLSEKSLISTRGIGQSERWWAWSAGESVGRMEAWGSNRVMHPWLWMPQQQREPWLMHMWRWMPRWKQQQQLQHEFQQKVVQGKAALLDILGEGSRGLWLGSIGDVALAHLLATWGPRQRSVAGPCLMTPLATMLPTHPASRSVWYSCWATHWLVSANGPPASTQAEGGREKGDSAREGRGDAVRAGEDGGEGSSEVSHT